MSVSLAELGEKVAQVSELHARRTGIERDRDWHVLKLQEELGELAAEYLRVTGRGRKGAEHAADSRAQLADETADLFAQLLLFAAAEGIDIESALDRKWFKHLR